MIPPADPAGPADEREVLLFDLGGVLVDFRGFEALNEVRADPLDTSEIRSRWLACEAVTEFECGRIEAVDFAQRFVDEWELDWSPASFLEAFASWVSPFSAEVTELLSALAPHYTLACLSNCNTIHWKRLGAEVHQHFDAAFLSFEMGLAKPNPQIFARALEHLDVPPERVYFFDDSEENLRAASEHGICAELVRGVTQLRTRLRELGMLRHTGSASAS